MRLDQLTVKAQEVVLADQGNHQAIEVHHLRQRPRQLRLATPAGPRNRREPMGRLAAPPAGDRS
jgi:hypothetical protein